MERQGLRGGGVWQGDGLEVEEKGDMRRGRA